MTDSSRSLKSTSRDSESRALEDSSSDGGGDARREPQTVAVIDVGTTSIRMEIAEIDEQGEIRSLQRLFQAVNLGREAFTRGSLRKSTVEECVRILRSYRRVLDEYQINRPEQMRIVATSAIREANNQLMFLDRVYSATGFQVDPIEPPDVIRITYLGLQPFLQGEATLFEKTSMVLEVGGGSTELMLVQGEDVLTSQTYRVGTVRLRESQDALRTPHVRSQDIITDQITHMIEQMQQHVGEEGIDQMVALGGDMRFAASQLLENWTPHELGRLSLKALDAFTSTILAMTPDQIVRKYRLSYADAETLGPALLSYVMIAKEFDLKEVFVTRFSLRDGLLKELANRQTWNTGFDDQIIRSAREIVRKFQADEAHADHVERLSRELFQAIREAHGLDQRHEVLLRVASLLHECGMFIGMSGYHKHTAYLIIHSDLFGLSRRDLMLTAMIARYHRRASPKPSHQSYASLTNEERVLVRQLAAILRVADALDRSRSQRIRDIQCEIRQRQFVINVPRTANLAVEQLALKQKGPLFEEIFGMQVVVRPMPSPDQMRNR
ncbi:MAG: exopolyphosphatase [Planctomycetaceae bacterium]|nr:exopolyphosphatase [Planctomycetaceae bacterium]